MINFCLTNEEKDLLKSLVGKRLVKLKHDPFDKFGKETVYGRVELYFEDSIVLIDYDYQPYPLLGSQDNDRPKFCVRAIEEGEACSSLQNTAQIYANCGETINGITLVEDYANVEWDGNKDDVRILTAIIFKFGQSEMAIQGDYMIPLLDIIRGDNVIDSLSKPGEEFDNDPSTSYSVQRNFVVL